MRISHPYGLSKRLYFSSCCWAYSIIILFVLVPVARPDGPTIYGTLPERFVSSSDDFIVIEPNEPVKIALFGTDVDQVTYISFSTVQYADNGSCEHQRAFMSFPVTSKSSFVGFSTITLRELARNEVAFFLCILVPQTQAASKVNTVNSTVQSNTADDDRGFWIFATHEEGSEASLDIRVSGLAYRTTSPLMPLWLQVILIIILFTLSGLFSGLNLGLMSLDKTELKIIETAGSPSEKNYAKAIRPIREKGNLLLCTLLLGNVLVNTSLTILMDNITGSGLFAVVASTIGITLFGEIVPQAVCSRHGLAIGARTLWLTKAFMLILLPVAYPIGFVLDKALGEELGQVYSREKLCVLINEQAMAGTVAADERNIITGALALTTKTVADIMCPLSDAFMLSYDDVLDFNTMHKIYFSGYTRIPVYQGERGHIRSVLNIKDLAFVNTEHRVPISIICEYYRRPIIMIQEKTHLDAMLKEFRQGKAHMAFVERLVTRGDGDPQMETIGLVTLEDVIEEIIQAEIVDETDIYNFPSFSEDLVSNSLLQTFLNSDIVCDHIFDPNDDEANILYRIDVPSKVAIFLLKGRASVAVGDERLVFEAESFYMFGESLLTRTNEVVATLPPSLGEPMISASLADEISFTPDYTLTAKTNLQYLRITPSHYMLLRLMHKHRVQSRSADRRESEMSEQSHPLASLPSISLESQNLFQHAWERRAPAENPPNYSSTALHGEDVEAGRDSLSKPLACAQMASDEVEDVDENRTITSTHRLSRPNNLALQSGDIRTSRAEELNSLLASSRQTGPTDGEASSKRPPPDQNC